MNDVAVTEEKEITLSEIADTQLAIQQTQALTQIGKALTSLSTWITQGGLTDVLSGYARSQAVKDILGGLAAHDGRNALDARVLTQNALEIVEQVEKVFSKYEERLAAMRKEPRDPEIHDAEKDFKKFKESPEEWKSQR